MKLISNLLAIALLLPLTQVWAVDSGYPSKPVTLIVPLAAGSTNDVLARAIQPELGRRLGQPVVVENKTGAGGQIGMQAVARAAPDGYTLILAASNTWAINVGLFKKLSYDPIKDFTPVAYLATASNALIVRGDSPWNSVKDMVDALRAQPGRFNFSSGGNGTSQHLGGELLKAITNTHAVHIPFGGAPQGVTAVTAGQVDFGFYNTPSVLPLVQDGRLKALAVTSRDRSVLLPGVPTMAEAGFKDYQMGVAIGVLAPAGTPPPVIAKLHAALEAIVADRDFRARLESRGYDTFKSMTPGQLGSFIQQEIAWWSPLVKRSGASID
ncbi:tripartite tricarboxylate transporter substrate binding protein [Pseudorhodoferax sp. Leaf274]|uniref:Bug family tripartite tricarboxylate transporter substrate binding protein n=1 Tax=Pseudorhodoferax sp. Leaf274 TaxID=1736318 RepID=UPI000A4DEA6D|nr:tripartite tricarboxylate transporter substrate binding protein [Pseudorhodoferax sp. Leaf274]